jgi:hypothetical protein
MQTIYKQQIPEMMQSRRSHLTGGDAETMRAGGDPTDSITPAPIRDFTSGSVFDNKKNSSLPRVVNLSPMDKAIMSSRMDMESSRASSLPNSNLNRKQI